MLQLVRTTKLHGEQREYVEIALDSGKSLLVVINDILDLSRIEAGKFGLVEETFDLPKTLKTMAESFRLQAMKKRIRLHCDIDENIPDSLVGDEPRIRQILFNLIGNSLKFTEKGEIRVQASLLTPENGGGPRLLFSVSDTGIGIPENKLAHIFEPFTQADGAYSRKYQGTGLGLGIVKRLVKLMGGEISAESEDGAGTVVHFFVKVKLPEPLSERRKETPGRRLTDIPVDSGRVPLAGRIEQPEVLPRRRRRPSGRRKTDISFSPLKILVAEDNLVNRMFAVKLLETLGHAVTAVGHGKEALTALEKDRFDAVFMDVQMPVMDGVEAIRAIRGSTSGNFDPEIPVIALTAHAMAGDREKFLEMGMNGYLAKPVEMGAVQEVLYRMRKKPERQAGALQPMEGAGAPMARP